jgi:hypothetical protein
VSFELSVVKECEQDIWEESILPKFKVEHDKIQAERLEQERIRLEKETEFKRQQEEFERKQKELAEKEAALKAAQEEQEKKRQEEITRKAAEERERIEKLWRNRLAQLNPVGWNGQEAFARYDESVIVATYDQLITISDDEFTAILEQHQANVKKDADEKEQKRLAEIEAQKEAERIRTLGKSRIDILKNYGVYEETKLREDAAGKMPEDEWEIIRSGWQDVYEKKQKEKWETEQEEKRKQEEIKKQQEMDQAKDKDKWEEIMRKVNEIEVYDMRSSQYRKKAMILREKLQEIKAL